MGRCLGVRGASEEGGSGLAGGKLDETIGECRAALDLVEGGFLAEDPYEEWAVEARQEWRENQLSVFSLLAECLAQKGRYTEAIEACEDALALERYSEDLHRRLMLYRYCSGEQGLALSVYRKYAGVLEEQLFNKWSSGKIAILSVPATGGSPSVIMPYSTHFPSYNEWAPAPADTTAPKVEA